MLKFIRQKLGTVSLRISMLLVIFLCWVLPLALTVGISSFASSQRNYQHISDVVSVSIDKSCDNALLDLNAVIEKSLEPSYTPTIRDAFTRAQHSGNSPEFYTAVKSFLSQHYGRSALIRNAYFLFPTLQNPKTTSVAPRLYAFNKTTTTDAYARGFYSNVELSSQLDELFDTLGTDVSFVYSSQRLYLVRLLSFRNNRYAPYAVLALEINQAELFKTFRNLPWLTDVTLYIGDIPISALGSNENLGAAPQTSVRRRINNTLLLEGRVVDERYILSYRVSANLTAVLDDQPNPLLTPLWLVLLAIPLLGALMYFFHRKVTRPIARLGHLTQDINNGNFGAQIDAEKLGSAEFNSLGQEFNEMSARLHVQFETLYREEIALRDARIKALQSQINPHFLGNTLELITWEARLAGDEKVSSMMEALSTMIGATLDRQQKPMISLREELSYVDAYLYIIKQRLGERLQIVTEIDDDLLHWEVPRLVLQPIVENAVEHGVSNIQDGMLTIRAYSPEATVLILEVENNSPLSPLQQERIDQILHGEPLPETSANIGIRNVHQRLRILYGKGSGLSVKTSSNGHTISSICMHSIQNPQDSTK